MTTFGAVLALWFALPLQGDGDRCQRVRVELHGPLREVVLASSPEWPAAGVTRILADLRAGETRTLTVPVASGAGRNEPGVLSIDPASAPRPAAGASASGAQPDGAAARVTLLASESRWARVAPGLKARPLPPVGARAAGVRSFELAWIVATALLVAGSRRRPSLALAAGLLGAAGVLALRRLVPVEGPGWVAVLEVDLAAGSALWVEARGPGDSSRDAAGFDPIRVQTAPQWARLDWTLDLRAGGEGQLTCRAAGAVFTFHEPRGRGWRDLGPAENGWCDLARTWLRSAAGTWSAHGPWPAGGPLPAALETPGMPPGWLASGLPPGRAVLIALVAARPDPTGAEPVGGQPSAPGRRDATWLRAAGFELE